MADSISFHETENIHPIKLPEREREEYFKALSSIKEGYTGRFDAFLLGNAFIGEAVQMLENSIFQFEEGFSDSAYYSLRSAVEISVTMVFLSDMSDDKRNKYFDEWEGAKKFFPSKSQMITMLSQRENEFSDMREQMPDFFENEHELWDKLNNNVHKRGLQILLCI